MPHHGGGTSLTAPFLEAVSPELTIISVGADNRFGHPDEVTLETLGGLPAYRADQDGNIESGDGDKVILVFGERRGGSYTYAIDATDPDNPILLRYLSPDVSGFEEVGQSWCTPVFGKIAYDTADRDRYRKTEFYFLWHT